MQLTPEQQTIGRRNFLKAVAGVPALAGLGTAAALKGPVRGGPVRVGFIGLGGEGRVLLAQVDPAYAQVLALADINPDQLTKADEVLAKTKRPAAKHYTEWEDMIRHEDIEAVVIAVPLWAHADVASACMAAGKHVLCEKMMAWDEAGCLKMRQAALDNRRVLEIGYQRNYNQMYQAAYDGIVKAGLLGDVYMSRIAWHRNGNWRRQGTPPSKDYNPSKWGYPDFEHLWNWRLYNRYSRGLIAELASHELNIVNWFFAAEPTSVMGTGGVYRWKDGREVPDHVYVTWEYADGRTAVFSSVESNAFDHYYEAFFGTKGTLILQGEAEAYLFDEGTGKPATSIEVTPKGPGPALEASESRVADAAGRGQAGATSTGDRLLAYRNEISGFCSTVRTAHPLLCGPDRAMGSARACIAAVEAVTKKSRVEILPAPVART